MLIIAYGILMGVLGLVWYYIGISMGYLYELMGTLIGSAVAPVALGIMSKRANRLGCITAAWTGLALGLTAWLVTAATLNDGVINIETTGQDYPMLAGNLAALGGSCIIAVGATLLWPENYTFPGLLEDSNQETGSDHAPESPSAASEKDAESVKDKSGATATSVQVPELAKTPEEVQAEKTGLQKAFRFAMYFSLALTVILIFLIPIPLFFSSKIYTESGFATWVGVSFVWVFYAVGCVVLYPVWESRQALKEIGGSVIRDMMGGGRKARDNAAA